MLSQQVCWKCLSRGGAFEKELITKLLRKLFLKDWKMGVMYCRLSLNKDAGRVECDPPVECIHKFEHAVYAAMEK